MKRKRSLKRVTIKQCVAVTVSAGILLFFIFWWILSYGLPVSSSETGVQSVVVFVGAFILSLGLTYTVASYFLKPLFEAFSQMEPIRPQDRLVFYRSTGIFEIDSILQQMEQMVKDSSCPNYNAIALEILEKIDLPIGMVSVDYRTKDVFASNLVQGWFNPNQDVEIDWDVWQTMYSKLLTRKIEGGEEDVYLLDYINGQGNKWLKVIIIYNDYTIIYYITDVTDKILEKKRLEYAKDEDGLTGLFKRYAFFDVCSTMIIQYPGKKGIMVYADLDNLKYVNDTYGYDVGDQYIKKAAEVFSDMTDLGAVISRVAGDEFAVFLFGYDSFEMLEEILNEYVEKINCAYIDLPQGGTLKLRCSLGYSYYPDDSRVLEELLHFADYAAYEVKKHRKGSIRKFSQPSYMENSFLTEKKEDFDQFLEQNLVKYAFQPIVDVRSGEIFAYEALMRPQLKELSSPMQILKLAKEQAKLYEIEKMTLFNVIHWIADNWNEIGSRKIFINSIPDQKLTDEDFLFIKDDMERIAPNMVIEITENENADTELINEKVEIIRGMGGCIALDDFGSGYSNELNLLNIKPDFVKIDRSLVIDCHMEENKRTLVENIIRYARPLQIKIIAEGIESYEELECLIGLGVDYIQGFYLMKPNFHLVDLPEEMKETLRAISAAAEMEAETQTAEEH